MPRKKKKSTKQISYASYIVVASSYSAEYSFGLGAECEPEPYSEYLYIKVQGVLRITDSRKVSTGTQVKMSIQSDAGLMAKDFKPKAIAWLSLYEDALNLIILLPPTGVQYMLSMLNSGKVDAFELHGTELSRKKADINWFNVTTAFEWEDWEETAAPY